MNQIAGILPKKIGYGVVRDEHGVPKFDDPSTVAVQVIRLLTARDWKLLDDETRQILEERLS